MQQDRKCVTGELLGPAFARWLTHSPGSDLIHRENQCLDAMLSDLFGYYLLQVGCSREFFHPISNSRIRHHIALEPHDPRMSGDKTLIADERAFPIGSDAMDVVFLPHVLEFSADPHQVLRETERVLIAEGRVIILGFNPISSWGLWRLFRKHRRQPPWCGRFLTPLRISDWLSLLGFQIEQQRSVMFLPPLRHAGLMRQLARLEPMGQRWLSMFSGAYAIRAVKRVSVLTPLQPSWKQRRAMLPGRAVEPTTRGRAGV